MNPIKKAAAATVLVAISLTGGAVGSAVFNNIANAQTTTTPATSGAPATTQTPSAPTPAPSGKFTPNEDPTHEKGESAAREAQEDAGQVPTVP